MATFGIDVESQLTTARPARLILNAGRMMKGLERREELEFPIGVEISTNLALSGPGAAPAYQTQLALNEGVRLEVSKAALRGTFDEIPRKGSKVDIATSICDPQATIANIRVWLRRSAEGDQAPGNWYEMPISDVVKARLWNFYIPHRDAFKQKGRPFPSAMPNLN